MILQPIAYKAIALPIAPHQQNATPIRRGDNKEKSIIKEFVGTSPVVADDRIELSDFGLWGQRATFAPYPPNTPRYISLGVKQNAYSIALISKLVGRII